MSNPYDPPPFQPYQPGTPQPGPPRRKRHWLRNTLLAITGVIVLIIVIGVAASSGSKSPRSSSVAAGSSPAAAQPAAAAPSPTAVPIDRVEFVVTGQVPAGEFSSVDISYGSDTDQHDRTVPSLSGRVKYVVPFDGSALYYAVNVDFTSAGHVSCKIVILGPSPDVPTTVAHGSADSAGAESGGVCSAQAAPDDSTGTSWEQE